MMTLLLLLMAMGIIAFGIVLFFLIDFEHQRSLLTSRLEYERQYLLAIAKSIAEEQAKPAIVPVENAKIIGTYRDNAIYDEVEAAGKRFVFEGVDQPYLADGVNFVALHGVLYKHKEEQQDDNPLPQT